MALPDQEFGLDVVLRVGHEVLWVVRQVLSGEELCARSMLSSAKSPRKS
jgi:hypothetical protein